MSFDLKTMDTPGLTLGLDGTRHLHTAIATRRLRNRCWEATCTCGLRVTGESKALAIHAVTLRPCT